MALRIARKPSDVNIDRKLVWEGPFLSGGALSLVNRSLVTAVEQLNPAYRFTLRAHSSDDLSLRGAPGSGGIEKRLMEQPSEGDIWVRHHWPANWTRPRAGRFVVIQPWEYGSLPVEWVEGMKAVDETWVHSSIVQQWYLESGVPESKIHLVPLGVDTTIFHPEVEPASVATGRGFRFLFVGGTIPRKGVDILLSAYCAEFTAQDDVCLVIKDFGSGSFYRNQGARDDVMKAMELPNGPEIVYINSDLSEGELAGLYAASDCLVHPYRAEGFGLTVAEGMACGLPVIVTGYGSCMDFCSEESAYLIPYEIERSPARNVIGVETVGYPHWAQPSVEGLRRHLRHVFEHRDEAEAKGRKGSEYVRASLTWERAATAIDARLKALSADLAVNPRLVAVDHKEEGFRAFRESRWGDAVSHLSKLVESDSGDVLALNTLAVAFDQLGDTASAKRVLRRATEIDPRSAPAFRSLAALLAREGRILDALAHAITAVEIEPGHSETMGMLTEIRNQARSMRCASKGHGKKHKQRTGPSQAQIDELVGRANRLLKAGDPGPRMASRGSAPTLSLCMIARNEERLIGDCLRSVQGVVDEIIVLDTGSSDATVEIAKALGAKVFTSDWADDFAAARNKSIEHATGDWVLVLDADERLVEGAGPELRAAIGSSEFEAYNLRFRNFMSDEPGAGDVTVHRNTRLHRRRPEYRYRGRVHELVTQSVMDAGGAIGFLDVTIDHLGYAPGVVAAKSKYERNKTLIEAELAENPSDPFHWHNMGVLYSSHEMHSEAVPYLQRATELLTPSHAFARATYAQLANALRISRRAPEAISVASKAESLGLGSADLSLCNGNALLDVGRYSDAYAAYDRARGMREQLLSDSDLGASGYKAYCGLAAASIGMGRMDEAVSFASTAASLQPDDPTAYRLLVDAHRALGQSDEVERNLRLLVETAPSDLIARLELGDMLLDKQDFEAARSHYARAFEQGADSAQLRMNMARCALLTGDEAGAQTHLEGALSIDPRRVEASVELARLRAASGDHSEALDLLANVIESDPGYANAYFVTADLLCGVAQYEQAISACEQGLLRQPTHAPGYLVLGNCYFNLGAFEAARVAYRQAVGLNPGYTEAANNLQVVDELLKSGVSAA